MNNDGRAALRDKGIAFRPWRGEEFRGLLVETGPAEGTDARSLTLPGFLAKWAFLIANDPVRALAYVRYLGFEGPAAPLFAISKTRRQERKSEQLQRSVLEVLLTALYLLKRQSLCRVCSILGGKASFTSRLKCSKRGAHEGS